ncbi:uncharacterized protein [Periplaneta americana]|uniref:uncharacterized protein n=1 Tax=Periplaneta americana TaxID=6978 RepID=UPI0037E95476
MAAKTVRLLFLFSALIYQNSILTKAEINNDDIKEFEAVNNLIQAQLLRVENVIGNETKVHDGMQDLQKRMTEIIKHGKAGHATPSTVKDAISQIRIIVPLAEQSTIYIEEMLTKCKQLRSTLRSTIPKLEMLLN